MSTDAKLRAQIEQRVRGDAFWEGELARVFTHRTNSLHVAVMVEPYLSFVLNGTKQIESRFARNRIPPYEQIHRSDLVLLKKSSGPVVGIFRAEHVWFYRMRPETWDEIRTEYQEQLCAQDPRFWIDRSSANYATLIRIGATRKIDPFPIDKRDRRGWVVVSPGLVRPTPIGRRSSRS
jgi:hypothetical protein